MRQTAELSQIAYGAGEQPRKVTRNVARRLSIYLRMQIDQRKLHKKWKPVDSSERV